MTIFSPNTVATVAMRTSSGRPSTVVENWPSCGRRFSTMFMPLMILRRLIERVVHGHRQLDRLDELTVDAEPDAQLVVERLDVDVAGAVAHRLADDAAHELHHRRLVVEADLGSLLRLAIWKSLASANVATSRLMSASERHICSMNDITVLGSLAYHSNA